MSILNTELSENWQEVLQCLANDSTYQIQTDNLAVDILVEIDAFLFEFHSAREKLIKFLRRFYRDILGKKLIGNNLRQEILSWGVSLVWETKLADYRHLFIHQTSPWIAFRIDGLKPPRGELVVEHDESYKPLSDLKEIVDGFYDSLWIIQKHLKKEIGDAKMVQEIRDSLNE